MKLVKEMVNLYKIRLIGYFGIAILVDGCTIEENPLSMDGMLLDGMRFPARDGWSVVFIKF